MPRVEESLAIACAPEPLFAATLDLRQLERYPEWNPAFARGLRVVTQTGGAGTVFEFPLELPGAVGRAEIIGYEPPHLLAARISGGIFARAEVTWTLAEHPAATLVMYRFDYGVKNQPIGAVVDLLVLRPKLRESAREQLAAMRERAERLAAA